MISLSAFNAAMIALAAYVCAGSLKLGFGSFSEPGAGFMPFLAALALILLSLADLVSGALSGRAGDKSDRQIWSGIAWKPLLTTAAALVAYALVMPLVGFTLPTFLLLALLFRVIDRRPWWRTLLMAAGVAGAFYLGFGLALGAQLPAGLLGF